MNCKGGRSQVSFKYSLRSGCIRLERRCNPSVQCSLGGGCLSIEWRRKGKRSFAMPSCRSEKWAHHMGSVTGGGAWDKVGHWPKLEGLAFVYTQCQEQHAKLVLRVIALPLSLFCSYPSKLLLARIGPPLYPDERGLSADRFNALRGRLAQSGLERRIYIWDVLRYTSPIASACHCHRNTRSALVGTPKRYLKK